MLFKEFSRRLTSLSRYFFKDSVENVVFLISLLFSMKFLCRIYFRIVLLGFLFTNGFRNCLRFFSENPFKGIFQGFLQKIMQRLLRNLLRDSFKHSASTFVCSFCRHFSRVQKFLHKIPKKMFFLGITCRVTSEP